MDNLNIVEIIEISNYDGRADLKVNSYLKAGWNMLNCAKQVDEDSEIPHEFLVYSLAWIKDLNPVHPEDI